VEHVAPASILTFLVLMIRPLSQPQFFKSDSATSFRAAPVLRKGMAPEQMLLAAITPHRCFLADPGRNPAQSAAPFSGPTPWAEVVCPASTSSVALSHDRLP
jgi:hypothetical protein